LAQKMLAMKQIASIIITSALARALQHESVTGAKK
jgi:hypothetical protein